MTYYVSYNYNVTTGNGSTLVQGFGNDFLKRPKIKHSIDVIDLIEEIKSMIKVFVSKQLYIPEGSTITVVPIWWTELEE